MKTQRMSRAVFLVVFVVLMIILACCLFSTHVTAAQDPPPQPQPSHVAPSALTAPTALAKAPLSEAVTTVPIACPLELYHVSATGEITPVEELIDEFEVLPERWLYVLTPLPAGESYLVVFDLSCRTQEALLAGDLVVRYSNDLIDGDVGGIMVTATERVTNDVSLAYTGEIRFIADGSFHLNQVVDVSSYSKSFSDHARFMFYLTTSDVQAYQNQTFQETASFHIDAPRAQLEVEIVGDLSYVDNIYRSNLTTYMYPYGNMPSDWQTEMAAAFAAASKPVVVQIHDQSHSILPYTPEEPVHHTIDEFPSVG